MELELVSFSAIFASFFFFFFFLLFIRRHIFSGTNSKLPPGPKKLPLIGNIHQLGSLPHRSLAKLASQYGPLMHIKLGELSCIIISSPEMAKEIMKTHDLIFANRPPLLAAQVITYGSSGLTFSPYGSYWRQMRKICTTELLTPKRVESFRAIREQELSNLVQEIKNSEGLVINLSEKISSLSYGLTSMAAFGGKSKDQEAYINMMKDVSKVASGFSVSDIFPSMGFLQGLTGFRAKLERLHKGMDTILENIVRDHRNKNEVAEGEDLVDVLLRLQKQSDLEHPLSNTRIKATIMVSMLLPNFMFISKRSNKFDPIAYLSLVLIINCESNGKSYLLYSTLSLFFNPCLVILLIVSNVMIHFRSVLAVAQHSQNWAMSEVIKNPRIMENLR